jgi:hypothetical protein
LNGNVTKFPGAFKNLFQGGHQWLTPVILVTQKVEIRRITVPSQPGQIVPETLSQKPITKKGLAE